MRNKCKHRNAVLLANSIFSQSFCWMWCTDCGATRMDEVLTFNVFLKTCDYKFGKWKSPKKLERKQMTKKQSIEIAVLERIAVKLENGTDCDDPRDDGGFYIYSGEVKENGRKVFFHTPVINDDGEYFEITCTLKKCK